MAFSDGRDLEKGEDFPDDVDQCKGLEGSISSGVGHAKVTH